MTLKELAEYIKSAIKTNPELRNDLLNIYSLAAEEVNDGNSETHECELAMESIDELFDVEG